MKKLDFFKALAAILIVATGATAQTIWNGTANTDWFTKNFLAKEFVINTAAELAGVAEIVNNGVNINGNIRKFDFNEVTITLGANIMLNDTTNWQKWGNKIQNSNNVIKPKNTWMPIGVFNGTFDGGGYKIYGIYINSSSAYQGFFGRIGESGTIKNLGVFNLLIRGTEYVGGLAGYSRGRINNIAVKGNVAGSNNKIGGIVGDNKGVISNSSATGNVICKGNGSAGGLVGYNGSFVGTSGAIFNSYSTGNVTGGNWENVGGLVGEDNYGTIKNSYTAGDVGRLTGTGGYITNSYYKSDNGRDKKAKATTAAKMKSKNFVGLLNAGAYVLSANAWEWNEGNYPTLTNTPVTMQRFSQLFGNGDGTESNPFLITTKQQLEDFSSFVNIGLNFEGCHIKLGANIQLNDTTYWRNWDNPLAVPANEWTPIGNSEEQRFNGTFDGNGFVVSGVYISDKGNSDQGLFGNIGKKGTLKNLKIVASFINGVSSHVFQELVELAGIWEGSYYAGQGETGLTLNVYEENGGCKALFHFYNLAGKTNAKEGSYIMNVSYVQATREYGLRFQEWVERPSGYGSIDISGTINGNVFSGKTSSGNTFRLVMKSPTAGLKVKEPDAANTSQISETSVVSSEYAGIVWNPIANSPFEGILISEIVYGSGKFIAIGNVDGKMAYSSDGVSWIEVKNNPLDTYGISNIVYGDGKFVAAGDKYDYNTGMNTCKMSYSQDGVTWTEMKNKPFDDSYSVTAIAWGNGKFIASGNKYDDNAGKFIVKTAYSQDGINWIEVKNNFASGFSIGNIAWGNNKFVAGWNYQEDSKMSYSQDGVTWTVISDITLGAIAWGNDKFVAVGTQITSDEDCDYCEERKLMYSQDGVTWTDAKNHPFSNISDIIYGDNKFVATGSKWDNEKGDFLYIMAYSQDGIIWSNVKIYPFSKLQSYKTAGGMFLTEAKNIDITAIAYGNGVFVAGSSDGKIAISK